MILTTTWHEFTTDTIIFGFYDSHHLILFHGDAIKPSVCHFVQYWHQRETKIKHDLTINISTTLSNIYQPLLWSIEKNLDIISISSYHRH